MSEPIILAHRSTHTCLPLCRSCGACSTSRTFSTNMALLRGLIPVQQIPKAAQDRAFALARAARRRGGSDNAIRQTTQGQALQVNPARPAQRREKQPFTAEDR